VCHDEAVLRSISNLARRGAMPVTSLILGIAGIVLSFVPVFGPLASLAALILGIICVRRKKPRRGLALGGLWMGAGGFVLGVVVSALMLVEWKAGLAREKESAARSGACDVGAAAMAFAASHDGKCPTIFELGRDVPSDSLKDPWGRDYVIECNSGELDVYSRGPDGNGDPMRCE
jgi:hypothetical protein